MKAQKEAEAIQKKLAAERKKKLIEEEKRKAAAEAKAKKAAEQARKAGIEAQKKGKSKMEEEDILLSTPSGSEESSSSDNQSSGKDMDVDDGAPLPPVGKAAGKNAVPILPRGAPPFAFKADRSARLDVANTTLEFDQNLYNPDDITTHPDTYGHNTDKVCLLC